MYNRPCRLLPRHTVSADFTSDVLANGLFVSIEEDGKQLCSQVGAGTEPAEPVVASQIRHVPLSSVHLGRVAAVNNLSREIAAHKYTVEQAKEKN